MSHNDYTKYARENKVETSETPVETEVIETPIVESEPVFVTATVVEPIIEETPAEPEIVEEPEVTHKMGRVFGCARLNVRKAPKPRAEVVCEINCGTEVEIDEAGSTIDFYKICTASGAEGYCVKTYINEIQ